MDPFHLPCNPIPLIHSCSSPPVDDPPVNGVAGEGDPEPKSPDPTSPDQRSPSSTSSLAKSSTSARPTSSRQLCSPLCSACAKNDPPSSYPAPSKSKKRITPHAEKVLSAYGDVANSKTRVLPVPADAPWDVNLVSFLYDEISFAEDSGNAVALRMIGIKGVSSALAIELRAIRLNMVVQGMRGCTSVIVVSKGFVGLTFLGGPSLWKRSERLQG